MKTLCEVGEEKTNVLHSCLYLNTMLKDASAQKFELNASAIAL